MTEQKVTDLSYLYEICMDDDRLVTEMIALFLENVPLSIKRLKTLVRQEEWSEVAAVSHKLKPNLAYVGLDSAREMIERVEKNAKSEEKLDAIEEQILQIEHMCKQSYKELSKVLKELRN